MLFAPVAMLLSCSVLASAAGSTSPEAFVAISQDKALTGGAGRLARSMDSNLERFEKIIATPGSRPKSAWRAAKDYLDQAIEDHKTILSRYGSSMDKKNSEWVKVEARLVKCKAAGKAFQAKYLSADGATKTAKTAAAPGPGADAKLPSQVSYSLKKVIEELDDFDRTMARSGKDKLGTWNAAKRALASASEAQAKILRDYGSTFNAQNSEWTAMLSRLEKSKATHKAFYDAEVDGGGTAADGKKKTGYDDARSIVAANNPNRRSIDRAIMLVLQDTERVRKAAASDVMTKDIVARSNRCMVNAQKNFGRMRSSYGSQINTKSDQYLAIQGEIDHCMELAKTFPAASVAYAAKIAKEQAEAKRLKAEAEALSQAESIAAAKKRRAIRVAAARFPQYDFKNAGLDKEARAAVAASRRGVKILRLQVVGPYVERKEARIERKIIEFGTYRYLRAVLVLPRRDGEIWVRQWSFRRTLQLDGKWGKLAHYGSFNSGYPILPANLNK